MDGTPALQTHELTKVYGEGETAVHALDGVSLGIERGEMAAIMGPSGSGKSTILNVAAGLLEPVEGEVRVFGERLTPKMQERIGYLPEERGLYKKMKVGDQLQFLAGLKGVPSREALPRIKRWTERLQISDWLDKKTDELSKGMQQKIQFIATILHEPDLVILDLMMPEVDGFAVLDALRGRPETANIPVIVATAKELTVDEKSRLQGQIQSLMLKGDFLNDEFLEEVRSLIR